MNLITIRRSASKLLTIGGAQPFLAFQQHFAIRFSALIIFNIGERERERKELLLLDSSLNPESYLYALSL